MAGSSHSTHQNRFPVIKVVWQTLLSTWSLKRGRLAEDKTAKRIFTENEPFPPSRRLVIILPDTDFDLFLLSQRIWNLAVPDHREVLLLNRPTHEDDDDHLRFIIATLANRIRNTHVNVETQSVIGISLDQAVQKAIRDDDVLVCFEEHRVHTFLKTERLVDALVKKTSLPVVTLKGKVVESTETYSARLQDMLLLAICMLSLVGFFFLEVWIDQNSTGAIHTILEILAVFVEAWTIAAFATKSFRF